MRRASLLFITILLTSCTTVKHRMLHIRAIDTNQDDVRALIMVNGVALADPNHPQGAPLLTPATLPLTFQPIGKDYEAIKIEVRSIVEKDGEIIRGLGERDSLPFKRSWRKVLHNDPANTLFILVEDPDYVAPRQ